MWEPPQRTASSMFLLMVLMRLMALSAWKEKGKGRERGMEGEGKTDGEERHLKLGLS